MAGIIPRLRAWLRWNHWQRELQEEIETHRSLKTDELHRIGLGGPALKTATANALGPDHLMREDARAVWLWPELEAFARGLRLGLRRLRRAPGFALTVILTLALGIGASTAIFSVLDAVLLHPLPYPAADRLVEFSLGEGTQAQLSFSIPQFQALRRNLNGLDAIAGERGLGTVELSHNGHLIWARGLLVTDGFFATLGATPRMGRAFSPADTAPGAAHAIMLSDALWRDGFGADPGILGQLVTLDGQPSVVVGVMPPGFTFQEQPADFYRALQFDTDLGNQGFNTEIIARLAPGFSLAALRGKTGALASRLGAALPHWAKTIGVASYQAEQAATTSPTLWLLFAGVVLLLVIACTNVAGLLLARVLARRPEIAMRRALGAGGSRLFVEFLAEGLVLATLGGAVGIVLAAGTARQLAATVPWDIPLAAPVGFDLRVWVFALVVIVATGLIFALASLTQLRRAPRLGRIQHAGRGRELMIMTEVALALLLVASAALFTRSLRSLADQPLGFDPAGRFVFSTRMPSAAAPDVAAAWRYQQQVLAVLNAHPGAAAASADLIPLEGQGNIPGEPAADPRLGTAVEFRVVSPGFFRAMGIPLQAGRDFGDADTGSAPPVAIVSGRLAQAWFHRLALGQQVRMGIIGSHNYLPDLSAPRIVVGVVGDTKVQELDQPARLTVYVPAAQLADGSSWWVVHGGGWDGASLRRAVLSVNPDVRVSTIEPYQGVVAHTLARPRFEMRLMGLFALLALLLTAIGLYGLLAFRVTQSTREIGVCMALGARPAAVLRRFLARGLVLTAGGLAAGLLAAWPLAHLLSDLLFGVQPLDPATLGVAAGLILLVALVACYWPARRASHLDPALTLRQE